MKTIQNKKKNTATLILSAKNSRAWHRAAVCAATGSVLLMLPAVAAETTDTVQVPTAAGVITVTNDTGALATAGYIRKSGDEAWEKFADGDGESEVTSEVSTEENAQTEGLVEVGIEHMDETEQSTEAATETEPSTEVNAEAAAQSAASTDRYDLRMETSDGVLSWYGLPLDTAEDLALHCTEDGAVFVTYYDPETKQEETTEDYAVHTYDEESTVYNTSNLNVRVLPDTDADVLDTLSFGSEFTAYGELDGWYLIATDDGYGYVAAKYVTDDPAVIEQKRAEQEAARVQAEQAAAAAQAADQAAGSSGKQKSSAGNKKKQTEASQPETSEPQTEAPKPAEQPRVEVSRENVADCDDPSHGTTYITYSDGSVEVVTY